MYVLVIEHALNLEIKQNYLLWTWSWKQFVNNIKLNLMLFIGYFLLPTRMWPT